MRYQQFASHAYCGAAGPVSKMASQQEKAFCVLRFEVSRSVITVQREFRARFRKDAPCVLRKICNNARHCILVFYLLILGLKCDKTKNTLQLLYIYAHRERILLTLYSNEREKQA